MSFISALLCISLIANYGEASFAPPRIIRGSDLEEPVIDSGSNYSLTCEGSQHLRWIYPHPWSKLKQNWTTFGITSYEISNSSDYPYRSTLQIVNMSYPFVGYYTCQYETSDDQDRIYLYVNDTDHLSVEDEYSLLYAVQYQETTIPCRPTSPDVEVQLVIYDDIKYEYNPKTGFNFFVSDIRFQDSYYCIFKHPRNNKSLEYPLFLNVKTPRAYLATPYIEDESFNHTDAGQTLNLTCFLQETSPHISFYWSTPRGQFNSKERGTGDVVIHRSKFRTINGKMYLVSMLSIRNSKVEDTGFYTCQVSDRQNNKEITRAEIFVHDTNNCYIKIREENQQNHIIVNASESVQWILDVYAHPVPELIWYDHNDNVIKNNSIFHTEFSGRKAMLRIENALLENDGNYKLRGISKRNHDAKNCPKIEEVTVKLTVYDKPSVCFISPNENCNAATPIPPRIYMMNEIAKLECTATGNPIPQITMEGKGCLAQECGFNKINGKSKSLSESHLVKGYFEMNTTDDGIVKCIGENHLGRSEATMSYYVSDVKDGFSITNFGPGSIISADDTKNDVIVAENETFTFTCAVCTKKSESVDIYFNGEPLNERHEKSISKTSLSKKITVSLKYAQLADSGNYSCRIKNVFDQSYEYRNMTLIVREPEKPIITTTNLNEEILIDYPKMRKQLKCHATGIPKPTVEWHKDNLPIKLSERIFLIDDGMTLVLNKTEVSDEGIYRCDALNKMGLAFQEAPLKFKVKPISVAIYYYITGSIGFLLLAALIYIFTRIRKEQELRRELKLLGLENFHNGSPENLNPELGIDDQAELLPYNKKFEFPIEHLRIGKQLGSGAFGVVLKSEAKGIVQGESKTTVAVKMVKKNADQSYIKALASELKIMVHLGKHINVVNLLGACTKNVAKRELLVIVEFCRFGNLQNYLYKHRETYINQVDTVTGNIDYNIGADILERSYSISSENCNSPFTPNSMQDYRGRTNTLSTQLTSTGEESVIMSNNSAQPEWRVNYKGDYRGDVKPISTRDLLTWSFQVARGMEYLASRKVLHGDLAARNILLADNNIVKICDFGLAKTMYNDNNYKKKGNSPLPVKWMAIESIRDRVFSTQSDVWSFGIVLWEFFSLAKTPYPGMEADERLYHKLVEGYRMESPAYAPRDIYKIMLNCWHAKPLARPSFTKLAEKIGTLLEDSVRKHYVDLNDPYLKTNIEKQEDSDYLAMLSPPAFEILSTPPAQYANAEVFTSSTETDASRTPRSNLEGYLFMGANAIFSPRIEQNNVFNFGSARAREQQNSGSEGLHPLMMNPEDQLESETGYLTPITPVNSISNPIYHHLPMTHSEKLLKVNKEFIRIPDNYITMPQYKSLVNSSFKDRETNKNVQLDFKKDNANAFYVNGDTSRWKSLDV